MLAPWGCNTDKWVRGEDFPPIKYGWKNLPLNMGGFRPNPGVERDFLSHREKLVGFIVKETCFLGRWLSQ